MYIYAEPQEGGYSTRRSGSWKGGAGLEQHDGGGCMA
jgi:hypothetical protein